MSFHLFFFLINYRQALTSVISTGFSSCKLGLLVLSLSLGVCLIPKLHTLQLHLNNQLNVMCLVLELYKNVMFKQCMLKLMHLLINLNKWLHVLLWVWSFKHVHTGASTRPIMTCIPYNSSHCHTPQDVFWSTFIEKRMNALSMNPYYSSKRCEWLIG